MADDLVGDQAGVGWMRVAVRRREASSLQRRQLALGFWAAIDFDFACIIHLDMQTGDSLGRSSLK
jgi:hypothetical protein